MQTKGKKTRADDVARVRVPPYSQEAERGVLGAALLAAEQTFEMLAGLRAVPEWFYIEANRTIFETAKSMFESKGTGVDAITVISALQEAGVLDQVGGAAYVERLVSGELVVAHAEYYAKILEEKFTLRRIIAAAEEAAAKCYEPDRAISTILSESQEKMLAISDDEDKNVPVWNEALQKTFDKINNLFQNTSGLTGLSSGFVDLDRTLQGLKNSEMIVLAARPSMGKTSLAMNICTSIALGADALGKRKSGKDPIPVGVFSCEMSTDSLITRLLCAVSQVPYFDIVRNQYASESERQDRFHKITRGASQLMNAPLYIDDTGGLDIADVRARARRMKKRYGIKFIMIDYLQLLNCREAAQEGRQLETTKISAGIKAMAKELDVPVLVLSQLSRNSEREKEGRPRLSDLRDSGSIEQDADVVLLLRRPCKYPGSKGSDDASLAIVDVAKNRNGRTGEVELTFVDSLTQFTDRVRDKEEDNSAEYV